MLGLPWKHVDGEWIAEGTRRIVLCYEPDIGERDNPYWRVCYGGSYIGSSKCVDGEERRAERTLEETMAFAEAYHAQNLDVTIDRMRRDLAVAERERALITVDIYDAMVTG